MQHVRWKHSRLRVVIVVLFVCYYLLCGSGIYTHFVAKLPGEEDLQRYTGTVQSIEMVSGRFSGDNIRIEFEDGRKILMNGSFGGRERIRTGAEATVLYQETALTKDWQGYGLQQGGEELHSFEASFRQMRRERGFNRILLIGLVLLPPAGVTIGLAYERRLLGKDTKYGA